MPRSHSNITSMKCQDSKNPLNYTNTTEMFTNETYPDEPQGTECKGTITTFIKQFKDFKDNISKTNLNECPSNAHENTHV